MEPSPFSNNVTQLEPSVTLAIFEIAQDLRKKGEKVYDFGVGEMQPSTKIPPELLQCVQDAMNEGFTKYCSAQGMVELREALAEDMAAFGYPGYTSEDIVVFPGAKPAIYTALLTLLRKESDDRVLAFKPSYEAFDNLTFVTSGKAPILINTQPDFSPDLHALAEVLKSTPNAKVLILNSPNNPTGVTYSDETLKCMADILKDYPNLWIVSDEVYRTLNYKDTHPTRPFLHHSIAKYLPERTIVVGAISKEVAGTGLRLGFTYSKSQPELVRLMSVVNGNALSSVNQFVQVGLARFLASESSTLSRQAIRAALDQKRRTALRTLKESAPLLEFPGAPSGAFYLFPNVTRYLRPGQIDSDLDLCRYLIRDHGIAAIPGSSFQLKGHVRIAYASMSLEDVERGCHVMGAALTALVDSGGQA